MGMMQGFCPTFGLNLKERYSLPHFSAPVVIFLLASGFASSFIDSTVGGGGLISLPALLFVGLPPALSLGTNKLAGSISALTSSVSFLRSKKVTLSLVGILFPIAIAGAVFGADIAKHLSSGFLKPLVVILLVAVTLYTLLRKNVGSKSTFQGITLKTLLTLAPVSFAIAFYDGFFGPGTGSFLIILFVLVGFDFVEAAGNAKVLNFASNIGALATFALTRSVAYKMGLLMGIGMLIGAAVGSQVAIRKGVRYVRPVFLAVTIILIGKQVLSLF